ncbi:MAG: glycosyltransferase family 39 protein [Myxococcota bacterium]|nr:glycosyltransferase family 39 protein [Myxococcota bacterium]
MPPTRTVARHAGLELALPTLLVLGLLLPFLGRALNIDDPIYVWIAQQIAEHPLDPYGFSVNWRGTPRPLHEFINNPPLASYFLALAGSALGWTEKALHAAFLLPALVAVWTTGILARRFGGGAATGALLLGLAPGFFVSSTTLMADVPMLALWLVALACWDRGLRSARAGALFAGAVVAGLCPLAKFPGLALLPLLAAHAILLRVPWRQWAPWMLVPLAIFGAYLVYTDSLYGHALLLDPVAYADSYRPGNLQEVLGRLFCALAFTGGSAASLLAVAPLLLDRRGARRFGILALSVALVLTLAPGTVAESLPSATALSPSLVIQLALWSTVGAGVLVLAVSDARETRSPESIVLCLWLFGIFGFAALLNWTVSVRGVLLLLPAAAILAARRIRRRESALRHGRAWLAAGCAAAAVFSFVVARADAQLAASARTAAETLTRDYADTARGTWFQGHWGFQYYAQQFGATPLERGEILPAGAIVIVPQNNSYLWPIDAPILAMRSFQGPAWCSTMNAATGAGFYASTWGPLPFTCGAVSPETYAIYASVGARSAATSPAPTKTKARALVRK